MISAARYRPKESTLCRVIEGESVILDVAVGQYYGLNAVGTRVWQCLADGLAVHQIGAIISQEFHVTAEEATVDIGDLISEFSTAGLIELTS